MTTMPSSRGTKRTSTIAINETNEFTKYITSRSNVVIMDGGTGSEIGNRAPESLSEDSWTGAAQLTIPQVIEDIHAHYLECGAQIVTTNTYASNKHCLAGDGCGERALEANQIACQIAKRACKKGTSSENTFVFGSISTHPPNFKAAVEAAAKAAETGRESEEIGVENMNATGLSLWPSESKELQNYTEQANALKEGGVDAIALEMVKDLYHGKIVLNAAGSTGLPVVLGITVRLDDQGMVYLRDEPILLTEALTQFMKVCPNIAAINVMHSPAEYCSAALTAIRTVWDGPIGAYPNNGTPSSWPEWTEGDLAPSDLLEYAKKWAAQGATLIGGCCGIGPAHIKALADHFNEKSPRSTVFEVPN